MLTKNCSRSFGSKARILRADREKNELSSGGAMSSQPDVCRICWCEALPDDGYKLISPCECAGSMKYVHLSCLGHWQQQLRVQKGMFASRRCDICKAAWRPAFRNAGASYGSPHSWSNRAFTAMQTLQPLILAVFGWWKTVTLARGVLQGLETGYAGFRLGMQHHATSEAHAHGEFANLVRWAPFSLWMSGILPALQFPVFLAMYATASSISAVQGSFLAMAGLYAGWVCGFAEGVTHTFIATLRGVISTSGIVASAVAAVIKRLVGFAR